MRINGLRWGWTAGSTRPRWPPCQSWLGYQGQVASQRTVYEIGSRDFRFRPDTGELEVESGPSVRSQPQCLGRLVRQQNANPLWHYVIADRYLRGNPYVPIPLPIHHVVPPNSPPVYPASPPEKRYHSFEQSGRFTSACSGMIYGDQLLFARSSQQHAFTCEPFHNLVQHNVLDEAGCSYHSRRAAAEGGLDFFASSDRWCRPVMVRTGPDGGLWVADMYRYMIEHPDWLTPEGRAELMPHYRWAMTADASTACCPPIIALRCRGIGIAWIVRN